MPERWCGVEEADVQPAGEDRTGDPSGTALRTAAVVPGFYPRPRDRKGQPVTEDDLVRLKKTASDVPQLIGDTVAPATKYLLIYKSTLRVTPQQLLDQLHQGPDYLALVEEARAYRTLGYELNVRTPGGRRRLDLSSFPADLGAPPPHDEGVVPRDRRHPGSSAPRSTWPPTPRSGRISSFWCPTR